MNTIRNGDLSAPLCDSENIGLTLVRLMKFLKCSTAESKEGDFGNQSRRPYVYS